MKNIKKILLSVGFLAAFAGVSHANTFKAVQMSTVPALQTGTTGYSMYIDSGTVKNLNAVTFGAQGNTTLNGTLTVSTITAAGRASILIGGVGIATFTSAGANLKGHSAGETATAGDYGNIVSTVPGAALAFSGSAAYINYGSMTLTPGDYLITGCMQIDQSGATWTAASVAISLFSANTTTDHSGSDNVLIPSWASSATTPVIWAACITNWRQTITTNTTVYLKGRATYSAGGPPQIVNGRMNAVKVY